MKKRIIFIVIFLLAITTFISFGFATFTFNNDSEVNQNVYVDPIKENYDFSGADNVSRETFDVYFFPQPRAAATDKNGNIFNRTLNLAKFMDETYALNNENDDINIPETYDDNIPLIETYDPSKKTPLNQTFSNFNGEGMTGREVTGRFGNYDGYFPDGTQNYKMRKLTGSLNNDILMEIGVPKVDMIDKKNVKYLFSGWSPSRRVAIDLGYGGTGDFELIETSSSFQSIDRIKLNADGSATMLIDDESYIEAKRVKAQGIDGSFVGDGKIYLYAIYTLGKDYNSYERLDCIETTDTNRSVYFSQYKNKQDETEFTNGRAYVARSLRLSDETKPFKINMSPTYFDFAGKPQWSGSPTEIPTKRILNNLEVVNNATTTNLNQTPIIDRLGDYNIYMYVLSSRYENEFIEKNNPNFIPTHLQDNRISDIFYMAPHTYTMNLFYSITLEMWIYVEEKVDIKVLGGNIKSLDYYHPDAQNFFSISPDGSTLVADNVMFDNINDKFYTINEKTKQYYVNTFYNRTFTVLPLTSGPGKVIPQSKIILSDDLETKKYITQAVKGEDYKLEDPILINLNSENKLNFFKINEKNIKRSVYLRFRLDIQKDGSYLLSAFPIELPLFVVIYQNKTDIKFDKNGFIDFKNSKDPLYICDKVAKDYIDKQIQNGNTSLTPLKPINIGQILNDSTNFAKLTTNPNTGKWEWNEVLTLGYILNKHKHIYDIAQDEELNFNKELVLIKNRVFYINNDIKN